MRRTERFEIRLTEAECSFLKSQSEYENTTVSKLIRDRMLSGVRGSDQHRDTLRLLLGQLGKVGANLNQLAYHSNSAGRAADTNALMTELRSLAVLRAEIVKELRS